MKLEGYVVEGRQVIERGTRLAFADGSEGVVKRLGSSRGAFHTESAVMVERPTAAAGPDVWYTLEEVTAIVPEGAP